MKLVGIKLSLITELHADDLTPHFHGVLQFPLGRHRTFLGFKVWFKNYLNKNEFFGPKSLVKAMDNEPRWLEYCLDDPDKKRKTWFGFRISMKPQVFNLSS